MQSTWVLESKKRADYYFLTFRFCRPEKHDIYPRSIQLKHENYKLCLLKIVLTNFMWVNLINYMVRKQLDKVWIFLVVGFVEGNGIFLCICSMSGTIFVVLCQVLPMHQVLDKALKTVTCPYSQRKPWSEIHTPVRIRSLLLNEVTCA